MLYYQHNRILEIDELDLRAPQCRCYLEDGSVVYIPLDYIDESHQGELDEYLDRVFGKSARQLSQLGK